MSTPTTDEDGTKWYRNEQGQLHCPDGPAVERANGTKEWWVNGRLHRTDGPAIEWADGDKEWWVNNQRHRTDGPAIEWAGGDKEWYLNGQRHRTDGPAWEWADGDKEWWVNGQLLTREQFNVKYGQQQPSLDGSIITINGITYKLVKQ
jgi:hypothetical protein